MKTLGFMIVGAQKCGTTALSHFLSQHPAISMADPKEAHLFDSINYSSDWSLDEINAQYTSFFSHGVEETIRGETTPIYLYFKEIAAEVKKYNPGLKVIVQLRDPVERAVAHYYMEKGRGAESLPFWSALLFEPIRLLLDRSPRIEGSARRVHSYRSRGLYSHQLKNIYRHFSQDQVLVIKTEDLMNRHEKTLERVFEFLGVGKDIKIPDEIVFSRNHGRTVGIDKNFQLSRLILKLSYLLEYWRLRRYVDFSIKSWVI